MKEKNGKKVLIVRRRRSARQPIGMQIPPWLHPSSAAAALYAGEINCTARRKRRKLSRLPCKW